MSLIGTALKHYSLPLPRKVLNQPLTASHLSLAYPHHPPVVFMLPHPLLLNPPIPLVHRSSILPLPQLSAGPIQRPTPPLPSPPASQTFASVLGSRDNQPQSALAVQND